MIAKPKIEKDAILKIVKELEKKYNSNTLSIELGVSRVGTFKALKELENKGILKGKTLGKARFYTVDLNDEYARKNVDVLLMEETKKYQRWVDEFKELFDYVKIAVLFGSITKNEDKANDIDLLLVYDIKNNNKISSIIKEKNEILIKRVHPIKQTMADLKNNIKKKDKVILNAIKEGIVLYGFEELLRVIEDATSRE